MARTRLSPGLVLLSLCGAAARAQVVPQIHPGDVVLGEIVDGDPLVETVILRQYRQAPTVGRAWRFEPAEPGTYSIELRSCLFDAYLVVRDELGNVLVEDDDGLAGSQSRVVIDAAPNVSLGIEACALHGGRGGFELRLVKGAAAGIPANERGAAEIADVRACLQEMEARLGPDDVAVAGKRSVLGMLLERDGRYEEARAEHERALAILERALPPEHLDLVQALNRLAGVAATMGDYAAARPLYERALRICQISLDPEAPMLADSLNNLGWLLRAMGDNAGARPLYERALAIYEAALGPDDPSVANILSGLGSLSHRAGDFDAALSQRERALAICERAWGPEDPRVAQALSDVASTRQAMGDYPEALALLERAVAIQETRLGREAAELASTLHNMANLLINLGDHARARPVAERSLAIAEKTLGPWDPALAKDLDTMAWLLRLMGDYRAARPLYEHSIAILEKLGGPDGSNVAYELNNLGLMLFETGEYDEARRLLERALANWEKAFEPDHPDIASAANNLAMVLQASGDLAGARTLYERALAIVEKSYGPEHPAVATILGNLAYVREFTGDPGGARPLFERALAIQERKLSPGHVELRNTLNNMALLSLRVGDVAGARPLAERSLSLAEMVEGNEGLGVADSLNVLGLVLKDQGETARARPLLERALAIREARLGGDHPDTAGSLHNLASLLEATGDYEAALPLYLRSAAIWEKTFGPKHPELATALNNAGGALQRMGDYAAARPLIDRSLAIDEEILGAGHPSTVRALSRQAINALECGDLTAAASLMERAEEGITQHLLRFVQAASEADLHADAAMFGDEIELSQSPALRAGRSVASYSSVLTFKGHVLRAARASRSVLRDRLGAEGRELADRLHDVTAALSHASTGFHPGETPLQPEALASLAAERQRLERELAPRAAGLLPAVPAWDELREALPPGTALVDVFVHATYQPSRRDGATVIERGYRTEPQVTAWITRSEATEPVAVDLGPAAAIEAAARNSRRALEAGRGASVSRTDDTAVLAQLLWTPLKPYIEGCETIIVSPDGVVATIPFEVLRDADGRYLVESRSFIYLTDPTDLVRMAPSSAAGPPGLLVLGDVDFAAVDEGSGAASLVAARTEPDAESAARGEAFRDAEMPEWTPLPATRAEIAGVEAAHAAAFEAAPSRKLSGRAASEEALKQELPRHSVVHLATHGYFSPDGLASLERMPHGESVLPREGPASQGESAADVARRLQRYSPGLLSGLVCAGANSDLRPPRDDGYLTAEEVGWLDLSDVDLVVLSACDTGLGRPQSGEGLLGLRRAFLTAGARTVVSSLWSVPDQETADLMERFYLNLWQRKMGHHQALRAAQLEILERNRARYDGDARPATWGAFVVDGDWR